MSPIWGSTPRLADWLTVSHNVTLTLTELWKLNTRFRIVQCLTLQAYRLATSKIALSDINNNISGLDGQLKHKRKLKELSQETRDPECKTADNWATKWIRLMTRIKELKQWEPKISNTDVTPQAISSIAKSLLNRDGQAHQLPFMVLQALYFIRPRKPMQLLTAWKISSHTMICVTKTINCGLKLEFKLCLKP
jgi:hypothetical protein